MTRRHVHVIQYDVAVCELAEYEVSGEFRSGKVTLVFGVFIQIS